MFLSNPIPDKFRTVFFFVFLSLALFSCTRTPTPTDHDEKTSAIIDRVSFYLNAALVKEAKQTLDSGFRTIENPGPGDQWRKYSSKSNIYLYYDVDLEMAKLYADSMMFAIAEREEQYKLLYAHTFFIYGNILFAQRKYIEAFNRFYDGRDYAVKHLDSCALYQFTSQLGMVKIKQKFYGEAITYFKEALSEHDRCHNKTDFEEYFVFPQSTYNAIAICYERMNQLDKARDAYLHTLKVIDERIKPFPEKTDYAEMARGVVYGNLGGVYKSMNDPLRAEDYLKKSIAINDRKGFAIDDVKTAKLKLVDLYLTQNRLGEVETLLDTLKEELDLAGQASVKALIGKWHKYKWLYFEQKGNLPKAHEHLTIYHRYSDSLQQVNEGIQNADMDVVFKLNEQNYKLNLLSKNNELKTLYLIGILLFLMMAISFLYMLWTSLRSSKNHVGKLERLNLQLQQALGALEKSQENNTKMMKIAAHDLRNPIGGMVAIANMLLEEKERSEEEKNLLGLFKLSGETALNLVNQLLQVDFAGNGLQKEEVDLYLLLQHVVEIMNFKAIDKQQHLQLIGQPVILSIDQEKIWRVISNIINNAIKFSPAKSTIVVQLKREEEAVLLMIKDEGIGISPEVGERVFDMFTDAKREGTKGEESFGLGLAISKQLVTLHKGKIWFENNFDQGTSFFIRLPLK